MSSRNNEYQPSPYIIPEGAIETLRLYISLLSVQSFQATYRCILSEAGECWDKKAQEPDCGSCPSARATHNEFIRRLGNVEDSLTRKDMQQPNFLVTTGGLDDRIVALFTRGENNGATNIIVTPKKRRHRFEGGI